MDHERLKLQTNLMSPNIFTGFITSGMTAFVMTAGHAFVEIFIYPHKTDKF